ncbi:MAG: MBL fold metallo-hydrolase [Conexivisphaera sp.]
MRGRRDTAEGRVRAGPFEVSVLAADSMGVRSMATVVDACGTLIGLDLGASIAPKRYGLPPHREELAALSRARRAIREAISGADAVVITHYHYDHYVRDEPGLYRGKRLFVKNPSSDVNRSQRWRARAFLDDMGVSRSAEVHYADGGSFDLGGPRLEFSRAVWHGERGTPVGKVIMVRISCSGESVLFASDVQGPVDPDAVGALEAWGGARLLEISGPPTYFAGLKVPTDAVEAGLAGLMRLIESGVAEVVIVDHHLLRDARYREAISAHEAEASRRGIRLVTAAEFMNRRVEQLEAMRRRLWSEERTRSSGSAAQRTA